MPTYDYRCPNGHDFEHFFRKISDEQSEFVCPVCGAVGHRRMSRGAGLVFKGSGFYLTDYGRNAHRTSGPEASGGDSKAESKGESQSDSKRESAGASSDSSSASKVDGAKSDGGTGSGPTPKADATVSAKTDSAKSTKSTESKQSGKTKGTSE